MIFFNSTSIAPQFSKITSFNSDSFRYTARTAILTTKQRFKFNDILFITSSISKFFIDCYSAILSFDASNIEKLNITFEKATIKALQTTDALLNRIYNHSKKMNARLNAIRNDANDAIESDLSKMKNAVFKLITKFVILFTKKLNALLKKKLKLRENIALMKEKAINTYVNAVAETYKFKKNDFYSELIITDN